jgi:hypothetical protein
MFPFPLINQVLHTAIATSIKVPPPGMGWNFVEGRVVLCDDILDIFYDHRELILVDIKVLQLILLSLIVHQFAPVAYRRERSEVIFWSLNYSHRGIDMVMET